MSDATFATPDLTTFARLDEVGLEATGQRLDRDRAVLASRVVEPEEWCRRCGEEGAPRDTVIRELAHEPLGWRPTTLVVTVGQVRWGGVLDVPARAQAVDTTAEEVTTDLELQALTA